MNYSLIIPHKNSCKLLERLLKSIYNVQNNVIQTIIIDDNSNNKELQLLKYLQKKYSFELYDNEGIGAGAARNTGLKYVKGRWTLFADADDYFCNTFHSLITKYNNDDSDIIFFNVTSSYSDTLEHAYRDQHIKNLINKYCAKKDEGYLRCCYTVPWGKMYKSSFLLCNNLKFEEIPAGNDMMFSIQSGIIAQKIKCDTNEIYCNTVTQGSITTTLSKDRFDSRFKATLRVNNFLRKNKYNKFQISILYFIAKAYQFGIKYFFHVLGACIRNKSNPFIGIHKLLNYKKVLRDRQNKQFTIKTKKP